MGVQLLQRLPRGVRLTQAGVTFYESAQRMLAEAARLSQKLARIPLLMTSLHRGIVERQLAQLGKQLNVQAEIDSVDSIRELVSRGRWATIMPVSVFKESQPPAQIVMSEISGVQLNRQLVLATRLEARSPAALSLVHELVDAEFSRLARHGVFSFGAPAS